MSGGPGLRLVAIPSQGPGRVTLDGADRPSVTAALADAREGSVVELGRGRYGDDTERFPLTVPAGVTLRGPAEPEMPREARKHLPTARPAELIAPGDVLEVQGAGVTLERLQITTTRPGHATALRAVDAERLVVDTCAISGPVQLRNVDRCHIRWSTVERGHLAIEGGHDVRITGGSVTGTHSGGPLVTIEAGRAVRVEAMAITNGAIGIAVHDSDDVTVGGCAILADGDAVRAEDCRHVQVNGNRLRGLRAVHLVCCTGGALGANGIERAEIGFALDDCTGVHVGTNHFGDVAVDVAEIP